MVFAFVVLLESILLFDPACNRIPLSVLLFTELLLIVLFIEVVCNESQTLFPTIVLFAIVILEELYNTNPNERCPERVLFDILLPLNVSIAIPAPLVTVLFIDTYLMVALDQFLR